MHKGFIMNNAINIQQLALDFQNLLCSMLPELIKEIAEEVMMPPVMGNPERLEKAIVEAILFHGRMQLFNVKEDVDDEEMDKTVKHIVSNPGEFRRYLKNKIVFA